MSFYKSILTCMPNDKINYPEPVEFEAGDDLNDDAFEDEDEDEEDDF